MSLPGCELQGLCLPLQLDVLLTPSYILSGSLQQLLQKCLLLQEQEVCTGSLAVSRVGFSFSLYNACNLISCSSLLRKCASLPATVATNQKGASHLSELCMRSCRIPTFILSPHILINTDSAVLCVFFSILVLPERVLLQHVTFLPVAAQSLVATVPAGFDFTLYTHSAVSGLPLNCLILCFQLCQHFWSILNFGIQHTIVPNACNPALGKKAEESQIQGQLELHVLGTSLGYREPISKNITMSKIKVH